MVEIPSLTITDSPKSPTNDVSRNKTVIRSEQRKPPEWNIRDKNRCIGSLSTSKTFAINANSSKIKGRNKPRLLKPPQKRDFSATIIDRKTM